MQLCLQPFKLSSFISNTQTRQKSYFISLRLKKKKKKRSERRASPFYFSSEINLVILQAYQLRRFSFWFRPVATCRSFKRCTRQGTTTLVQCLLCVVVLRIVERFKTSWSPPNTHLAIHIIVPVKIKSWDRHTYKIAAFT